jgi:hypothetical protein
MEKCTPEERLFCARHEATHVLFTVILEGWLQTVGIPRLNGNHPKNLRHRGKHNSPMAYVDCNHINPGLNGFMCLVGYSFEKLYGDPDRALWDYEDAEESIDEGSFAEAEKLAMALVRYLDHEINIVADQLVAKAKKDGVIEGRKLQAIEKIIRNHMGFEMLLIRQQIKRCCET